MNQPKTKNAGKTQGERFIEAAKEIGADECEQAFKRVLRKIATAPVEKPKKGSRPPKR
jgi:hypothetical protein